jgi:threonine/homoserine/homoserine lactone efflux protein
VIDQGLVASGIAVGLAVAAPIGPVNLIVIRRTLRHGGLYGFLSGLGAALGDAIFAAIAAFSVTAAIDFLMRFEITLQLIGGIFLIALGLRTFFAHPHLAHGPQESAYGLLGVSAATFALTITNPATMLGFLAIFGGIAGLTVVDQDYASAALLVVAVFLGSVLWWFLIALFASFFRTRMNDQILEIVNRISGLLISLFGVAISLRLAFRFFTG